MNAHTSASRRLHVVQISRDRDVVRWNPDAEPIQRQLEYARELARRAPGSSVTILALASAHRGYGWRCDNLRVVPVGSSWRGLLGCVPALRSLHRRKPISVITTQVTYDEGWLALLVGGWYGIPVIGQIHSDLFAEHAASAAGRSARHVVRSWAARHTVRGFAAIRTVSLEARAAIARLVEGGRLATIPVPVAMVSTGGLAATAAKEPLVIFVGRLAPEKDLSTWLTVARAVRERHPEARFEMIGDGPERARLQEEAQALGLGDSVTFCGFVPYADLRQRYASAAALLLTSREEGFGRVLVEAASQGTASVSTSLAGPRDIVVNGVTGFLHEPGDVEGLARSVSTLVGQPRRAAEMGARAQALVTARFDPVRLRAAWIDLWVNTARAGWTS
jgi:glycosyltransferase involved in cell wall biosynthesis